MWTKPPMPRSAAGISCCLCGLRADRWRALRSRRLADPVRLPASVPLPPLPSGTADWNDLKVIAATVHVEWQLSQARLLSAEEALAYYLALASRPAEQGGRTLSAQGRQDLDA